MRLLVTRPAHDAALLAEQLAAQGHDVIVSPLIDIVENDTALPNPEAYGALALTSANGVLALAARLTERPYFAVWAAKPAYAVGSQTAAALRRLDWPVIHQAAGDVDALAQTIFAHHRPSDGSVLHITGTHQAGNLAAALAAQGLKMDKAILYQAVMAETLSNAALDGLSDADNPIDAVLLYSPRSAQIFIKLYEAANAPYRPRALCLSAAIGALMQAAGFEVEIAATPCPDAMLALTTDS